MRCAPAFGYLGVVVAGAKKISEEDKKKINTLVILVCWSLWKQRNGTVFHSTNQQCSVHDLASYILGEFQ
jgi:hypothetical protein